MDGMRKVTYNFHYVNQYLYHQLNVVLFLNFGKFNNNIVTIK